MNGIGVVEIAVENGVQALEDLVVDGLRVLLRARADQHREDHALFRGDRLPAAGQAGEVAAVLGEFGHELRQQRATQRPQLAQLIEHQGRVGRIRLAQSCFDPLQHFLHASGRTFLLLDAVFEALHLVLDTAIGFLELGAIAEKMHQPVVIDLAFERIPAETQES